MASDNNVEEQEKSVSFKFTKKKTSSKLVSRNKEYDDNEDDSNLEKDFLHSAEGKLLRSVKPKEDAKELVIPCLPRNDLLFPHGKDDKANTLEREAAEEIMRDLSKDQKTESETPSFAIPLLAKTHLATEDENKDTGKGTAILPEESTLEDYNVIPVSQFGAAMLRGMGWKKGEAIGGTNKGLTVPIEFIPRSQGLGLGAECKHEENVKKKRRKPGDDNSNKHSGPIVEKDGKVRHFKTLDEKVPDKQHQVTTFCKGGFVVVESGPHKDLSGKITAVDEDNARVFVLLAINSEEVTLSQHNVRIVDKEEYKQHSKGKSSQHENNHRKTKRRREEEESENNGEYSPKKHKPKDKNDKREKQSTKETTKEHKSTEETSRNCDKHEPCWMAPLIRVRMISKSFKKGKYYHKKVIIQDVISRTTCICKTDEGRLLEDVPQSVLETVIPKGDQRFVLFVQGKHKGLVGEVVKTESSKEQAIVQILRDKNVVKVHYDNISEYVGDVHVE